MGKIVTNLSIAFVSYYLMSGRENNKTEDMILYYRASILNVLSVAL
jgi:hypothetical protein